MSATVFLTNNYPPAKGWPDTETVLTTKDLMRHTSSFISPEDNIQSEYDFVKLLKKLNYKFEADNGYSVWLIAAADD